MKTNFKNKYGENLECRACSVAMSLENENHLAKFCPKFTQERGPVDIKYEDVFGDLEEQVNFVKHFKPIARKFQLLIGLDKTI